MRRKSRAFYVTCTVVLVLLGVLVASNLFQGEDKIQQRVTRIYTVESASFSRAMGVLLGPAILSGNEVQALLNGDKIFPEMLAAIQGAQKTITFESYIYWSDSIGKEFADALAERARAGLKVHVLLDWVGSSKTDPEQLAIMVRAGVELRRFHASAWYNLARMNNRTHRKVLVTDGRLGFTGGVGIADTWRGDAQDLQHWRDTHFKVEGPVVAEMQAVFVDNWLKATGKVLHGDDYFPALKSVGSYQAQMFSSSPSGGSESMQLMYLLAITAATDSINLSSAYFVPDQLTERTLVDAVKRGVTVRIILPGDPSDAPFVRSASRARWGKLLEAGAQIYEYQPTMYHCKVMIVDTLLVSVGSTNFDTRSFRLNDEANLNIYSAEFALSQLKIFNADLERSRQVSLDEWQRRPLSEKAYDIVASMFGAQL